MLQRLLALVFLAAVLNPAHSKAQSAFSFGPTVGYYRPLGYFEQTDILSTNLPEQPSQLAGLAWGGSGNWRPWRRFGVEVSAARAESSLPEVFTPGGPRGPTRNHVDVATVEAQFVALTPRPAYAVTLGVGPAFVRHGGEGYSQIGSPSSWGAAMSVELQRRLSRRVEWVLAATGCSVLVRQPCSSA